MRACPTSRMVDSAIIANRAGTDNCARMRMASGCRWRLLAHRRLFDQLSDQGGPAGLVGGAEAGAGVAVEVLMEEDVVPPVRVGLLERVGAEDGAAAVGAAEEDRDQAAGEVVGDLSEGEGIPGVGWALHEERVAI